MKTLAKIFSILFLISSTLLTISVCFPDMINTNTEIFSKIMALLTVSVIPIITITVCSISFERKNESYLERIIMAYMFGSIIVFALNIFLPLDDINETLGNVINNIAEFISSSHLYLFPIALLDLVKPNNVIAKGFKFTAFGAIGINLIAQIWLKIKIELVDKLPNVYGHEGFNFASIYETSALTAKIYIVSIFIEVIAIISAFLTNYAFEETTIESESLDYDELKKQADEVAKLKINETYNKVKEEPINFSAPKEKGLMNINNQLGIKSNVGQVTGNTNLPQSLIDKSIPTSNGPVVNDVIKAQSQNNETKVENTNLINPALTINQNIPNTNSFLNSQNQSAAEIQMPSQNINPAFTINNGIQSQELSSNIPNNQANEQINNEARSLGSTTAHGINPAFTINQGVDNNNNK